MQTLCWSFPSKKNLPCSLYTGIWLFGSIYLRLTTKIRLGMLNIYFCIIRILVSILSPLKREFIRALYAGICLFLHEREKKFSDWRQDRLLSVFGVFDIHFCINKPCICVNAEFNLGLCMLETSVGCLHKYYSLSYRSWWVDVFVYFA